TSLRGASRGPTGFRATAMAPECSARHGVPRPPPFPDRLHLPAVLENPTRAHRLGLFPLVFARVISRQATIGQDRESSRHLNSIRGESARLRLTVMPPPDHPRWLNPTEQREPEDVTGSDAAIAEKDADSGNTERRDRREGTATTLDGG